jgi:hypothetical protein
MEHPINYYLLIFFFKINAEKNATLRITPPRIVKNTEEGTYFLAIN